MHIMAQVLAWIVLVMSLVGFIFTGWDKHLAKKHKWRIPEQTLFIIAILVGAPGVLAAMLCFRHKIRKWYFIVFIPILAILQITALVFMQMT